MALVSGIDHLILGVHDLSEATTRFADLLGFHLSGGGVHPQFGTQNRIAVIDDTYIELIAAQPGHNPRGPIGEMLASRGPGWIGYALATEDPRSAVAAMRAAGVDIEGPVPGRLETGDAFSRGWQSAWLVDPPMPGLPFLIRHESGGSERRRLLAGSVGLAAHRTGFVAVAGITVAVPTLEEGSACFERCYGLSVSDRGNDAMTAAATATFRLPNGSGITIAAPTYGASGPVATQLAATGPGLFAVTLAVIDLVATVRDLRGRGIGVRVDEPDGVLVAAQIDHRQTLGARFGLVQATAL